MDRQIPSEQTSENITYVDGSKMRHILAVCVTCLIVP